MKRSGRSEERGAVWWDDGAPDMNRKMVKNTPYAGWYARPVHRQNESLHGQKGLRLPKAAIFDLDGTLIDSVDLHALAWHEAMVKFGHNVSFQEARSRIGKGGDKLIPVLMRSGMLLNDEAQVLRTTDPACPLGSSVLVKSRFARYLASSFLTIWHLLSVYWNRKFPIRFMPRRWRIEWRRVPTGKVR
jgi:hypothetical protein